MLDNALDIGISECEFWNMTIAELDRAVASYNRKITNDAKERATYDYILASLIGRAYACSMSNSAQFPNIAEVYPTLFNSEDTIKARQKKQDELSAIRFIRFAQNYNNKKHNEVVKNDK